ncbi:hypothetical protein [Vibrio crassostreae]|uniref:hypothetical protein n=1 Tax=Vibrio crassostreae TaxID=246167 RepID=UPI001B302D7D|nr:hypothetical protein [Vibrio crassostreae]
MKVHTSKSSLTAAINDIVDKQAFEGFADCIQRRTFTPSGVIESYCVLGGDLEVIFNGVSWGQDGAGHWCITASDSVSVRDVGAIEPLELFRFGLAQLTESDLKLPLVSCETISGEQVTVQFGCGAGHLESHIYIDGFEQIRFATLNCLGRSIELLNPSLTHSPTFNDDLDDATDQCFDVSHELFEDIDYLNGQDYLTNLISFDATQVEALMQARVSVLRALETHEAEATKLIKTMTQRIEHHFTKGVKA